MHCAMALYETGAYTRKTSTEISEILRTKIDGRMDGWMDRKIDR